MADPNQNPYLQFEKESLILRDYLAADRTVLSIDRTFLAYIRTALTFLLVGVSFIKFFNSLFLAYVGIFFIMATPVTFFVGMWRIWEMKKMVASLKEKEEEALNPPLLQKEVQPTVSYEGAKA